MLNHGISSSESDSYRLSKVVCKVKSRQWEKFQSIGKLPSTFEDLTYILSIKFYPKDFIIKYIKEDFTSQDICNSYDYNCLLENLNKQNIYEIKLFVYLIYDKAQDIKIFSPKFYNIFEKIKTNKNGKKKIVNTAYRNM